MKKEQLDLTRGNAGFRSCYDITDDGNGIESVSVYEKNDNGDYKYAGSTSETTVDEIEDMDDWELFDWLEEKFGMTYIED